MKTTSDIDKLISEINDNKPMGTDLIPPKFLPHVKNIFLSPLNT